MIITTRASSTTGWRLWASLGLLSLVAAGPMPRSARMSLVGLWSSAHDSTAAGALSERAAFVIPGIYVLSNNDVWVVVSERKARDSRVGRSVILRSSDGGKSWERQLVTEARIDDRNALQAVHFVNSSLGWAAGYNGTILITTDGGKSWRGQSSPTDAVLNKIQFMDDNWGWILAEEGGEILHTEDGGRKWVTYRFPANGRVSSLSFRDKFNGWIVGEKGQVFQTTDSGRTWQARGVELTAKVSGWKLSDVNFPEVRFFSESLGFIAAGINYRYPLYSPNGVIFKTMDGGRTWKRITVTEKLGLKYASFVSEGEAWVVLRYYRDDRLLHTVDGGRKWAFVRAESKASVVQFADTNNGWLVAGLWDYPITDQLLRTNDGGQTWFEVSLPKWTDDK